ncbi:MAG: hydroxyisourate hydrolase [Candidatus Symbiobacter sp.]|nr:hydroxyisourate hydrolase [Candidatus Symbiobacter sp.]
MGKITTHVLDTSRGLPGRGIAVALYRLDQAGQRQAMTTTHTNQDGRCDAPLLEGAALTVAAYELDFEIGRYYAAQNGHGSAMPFLDRVTLRFGVGDAAAHYHVPLLVTPWSYATYRGS